MAASGPAGNRNEIGIAAVIPDVFLYPCNGLFHIDNMRRKSRLGAQTIVDRYTQPATLCHVVHQRFGLLFFFSDNPCSAMHLK